MKVKLFHTDINPSLWLIIDDMYEGCSEAVRWQGEYSREYLVGQGVKQGSIISPTLYKLYVNDVHIDLESQGFGYHIGPIPVGAPACADDFLLMTEDPPELQ